MNITAFKGINNVSDPLRLGLGWLVTANNVNVSDTGSLGVRDGYSRAIAGSFTSAYATRDYSRLYVVESGALKSNDGSASVSIRALTSAAPMYWTEINDQVFYNNGTDSGILRRDHSRMDWAWTIPASPMLAAVTGSLPAGMYRVLVTTRLADGRETGASDPVELVLGEGGALQISAIPANSNVYIAPANSTAFSLAGAPTGTAMVWNASPDNLGRDFLLGGADPLPVGADVIQAWRGRLYAAQYDAANNQTVVWFSQPLGFHLFSLAKDFFIVPGRVVMLAPHVDGLLVGADRRIYAYTPDGLTQLADYGAVPGQHWSQDDTRTLFWTTRGLCAALPFTNLTASRVSVAPGIRAGGTLVHSGGQKRYVVALEQGGSAFNSF
ncbi:MAG: hypothetical protein Q8N51_05835 [Gammaproteobacteria bacterium]|nr:hypothetical protein [Gammaproteobacteria bacterium]